MSTPRLVAPKHLMFRGFKYTLVQQLKDHGNGISEGPFYSRAGVDPNDWAYMPDIRYMLGQTEVPTFMHIIQQSAQPKTNRPPF